MENRLHIYVAARANVLSAHPAPREQSALWMAGLVLLLGSLICFPHTYAADTAKPPAPALALANVYREGIDPRRYWVSEKLDGVRAFWDGHRLISRNGHPFRAPSWFTRGFSEQPLDGELWMGRNTYEALSAAVRRGNPEDSEWRRIGFLVFDLPGSRSDFNERYAELQRIVRATANPHLRLVEQFRVADTQALLHELDAVVRQGGEGLMLHRGDAPYRAGRSDDLLKLKRYQDAEAVVLAHLPGKGKYTGLLGSLLVETAQGNRFRIGSGFSDEQRRHPPAPGSTITYKYFGLTANGIPRFASFLRVREEL